MTSNAWADALLVAVLLAPLASVVLAVAVAVPAEDRRWTTGGCALAAAGSIVLLVMGQHPHVSRLAPDDLGLAAAAATALLAVGVRESARTPVVAAALTIMICGLTAGSPGRPSTVAAVLAMAAATALVTLTRDSGRLTLAAISVGVVLTAVGVRVGDRSGAVTLIVGTAVIAVAASLSPRRAVNMLVPVSLVLALRVGPQLAGTAEARWLAVALALAGVGLAVVPAIPRWRATSLGVAALVPWALVSTIGPLAGMPVAARALAVGTVLALTLGGPLALLAAAPGTAMVASALAGGDGWPRPVLALLAIATVIGLTTGSSRPVAPRSRAVDGVAALAASWFVLRPTSWTWTRVEGLQAYSDGTVLAAATALIAGVALAISGAHLIPEPIAPWVLADDEHDSLPPARVDLLLMSAVALMGIIAAALLRSARL
ncbi:MAG: hypothetical protein QOD92_3089 [Acidimicrobiaceae bacterium]|jgi:hypothetical protein